MFTIVMYKCVFYTTRKRWDITEGRKAACLPCLAATFGDREVIWAKRGVRSAQRSSRYAELGKELLALATERWTHCPSHAVHNRPGGV